MKCRKIIGSDVAIRNLKAPAKGRVMYAVKQEPSLYLQVTSKRTLSWYLMTKVEGKVQRFNLGRYGEPEEGEEGGVSLARACEQARTLKQEIKAGVDHKERSRARAERKKNTFAAVRKRFMERHVSTLKENTQKAYQTALFHTVLDDWEEKPVYEVSRANVRSVIAEMAAETPVMANRMLAYLRKFFNWCAETGVLNDDEAVPTDRVVPPLKKETARKRWLSESEIGVFLRACDKLGYPFGDHFKMLLFTGQQKEEATHLEWPHIDNTAKQWTQIDNKADRIHIVPLNTHAMALVDQVPEFEDGEFLFTTRGDRPISGFSKAKRRLDEHIAKIVAKDELKGVFAEPWRIHDLRRTITTHLRKAGVTRDVCGKLLNHAERGVTALHYDQFDLLPEKTHAMELWGRTIERITTGKTADVIELNKAR